MGHSEITQGRLQKQYLRIINFTLLNLCAVVFVCAIKADGPLDSHKFSSGSLKGWHQIDLVEAKNKVAKIIEI